jgi:hypothetical protein
VAQDTVEGIERTVQKTYEWLAALCDKLGIDNRAEAYRSLRAFLHLKPRHCSTLAVGWGPFFRWAPWPKLTLGGFVTLVRLL